MKIPSGYHPWLMLVAAALIGAAGAIRDQIRENPAAGWGSYGVSAALVVLALYLFWRDRTRA